MQPVVQQFSNQTVRMQRAQLRRSRRRLLRGLRVAACVVVLCLSAALTVSVFALHLGIRPVLTGSMRPDYGPGAVLLTRQVPVSSLRPGMVVLFVPPGEHGEYAHRITSVSGASGAPVITTKGDANMAADPWHARITSHSVNEVVGSLPGVGRLLVGIRGIGQIALAVVGGLLAAWAGTRWLFSSSRPTDRRAAAGSA